MGTAVATGATDSTGALTAPISFSVPSVGPGTYKVYAVDNRSQYPVSMPFTVTP
jgi:hypothetical protein